MAKGSVNLGSQCWGALVVFALKYQCWLEIAGPAADGFSHRAQSVSDLDRLTGDAVGLEDASLGNCQSGEHKWLLDDVRLPVSK